MLDSVIERQASFKRATIEAKLLIEAIKAVTLETEHIEQMISLIDPQVQDLALVKIKLLEAKSDFVEAFMSYLNNERMHKNLFQWLLDTFESLTKK